MVDHLLKGTPDGIINRVQIRAIRWPYAGTVLRCGQGGQAPSLWLPPPQIFEGFPIFYHRHSVCYDMKMPSGQAP